MIATQSVLALGVVVSVFGFLVMVAAVGLFMFGLPGRRGHPGLRADSPQGGLVDVRTDGGTVPSPLRGRSRLQLSTQAGHTPVTAKLTGRRPSHRTSAIDRGDVSPARRLRSYRPAWPRVSPGEAGRPAASGRPSAGSIGSALRSTACRPQPVQSGRLRRAAPRSPVGVARRTTPARRPPPGGAACARGLVTEVGRLRASRFAVALADSLGRSVIPWSTQRSSISAQAAAAEPGPPRAATARRRLRSHRADQRRRHRHQARARRGCRGSTAAWSDTPEPASGRRQRGALVAATPRSRCRPELVAATREHGAVDRSVAAMVSVPSVPVVGPRAVSAKPCTPPELPASGVGSKRTQPFSSNSTSTQAWASWLVIGATIRRPARCPG